MRWPARLLSATDNLNLFALCHQRLFVVEMYHDSVLDTIRVATRRDVLKRRWCFALRDLKGEVPSVLTGWHLCPAEFEQAVVKFEHEIAANTFGIAQHNTVFFDKIVLLEAVLGTNAMINFYSDLILANALLRWFILTTLNHFFLIALGSKR